MNRVASIAVIVSCAAATPLRAQPPFGTAVTYQGQLRNGAAPASGLFDLRFALYAAPVGGAPIGPTSCADNVAVSEGVFTVLLSFGGSAVNGDERFLEVEVRADTGLDCADTTGFVTLAPRQPLTPTPYALQTRGIRVDPAGNVGIGTQIPGARLHVEGDFRQNWRAAFGNEGVFGAVGNFDRVFDFTHRVTASDTPSLFFNPFHTQVLADPAADMTDPFVGHRLSTNVASGNTRALSFLGGCDIATVHSGTGLLADLRGVAVFTTAAGPVTEQIGLHVGSDGISAATIGDNRALTIRSGHRTSGGSITHDYGLYIHTPARNSPLANHYGIYLENQGSPVAFPTSYAIYASGGQSYFRDPIGVGVASPQGPLHVAATQSVTQMLTSSHVSGPVLVLRNDNGAPTHLGAIDFQNLAGETLGQLAYLTSDDMTLSVNGLERLRVDQQGRVGIGTATPLALLHVSGGGVLAEGDVSARHPTDPDASVFLGWGPDANGNDVARIRVAGNPPNASNGLDIQRPGNISLMRITHDGDVTTRRNLHVGGTLTKAAGAFRIDHPLDPDNKYLYHSFVESPDMKNIYDGIVTTDERGYATIEMPEWFGALNRDFRYQLTVLDDADGDAFVQAKVVAGMKDNRFTIRTSAPKTVVSWMVTGIRHDPWAEANRIPLEVDKPARERGQYRPPEPHGSQNALRTNLRTVEHP
jgi:hypothetical protein